MKEKVFPVLRTENDLTSTLYHAIEWARRCDKYATRAEDLRDRILARFYRNLQQESCEQAEQARELLQQHTGLLWDP